MTSFSYQVLKHLFCLTRSILSIFYLEFCHSQSKYVSSMDPFGCPLN